MLAIQPSAGLDQRVVGVRPARATQGRGLKPPARPLQPHLGHVNLAGLAAGKPLLPRRLRPKRRLAEHTHLDQRSRELLYAVPARVIQLPRAQGDEQISPGAQVLEQWAAGQQHHVHQRVSEHRAPQRRGMTQPVHVRLHPADRGIHPRLVKHTACELAGLEPAQVKMQIPLPAHQVGDREHELADLRIAAGEHRQPPVAIPPPERAGLGGHRGNQRPADWAATPPCRLRRHDPENVVDRVGQPCDRPAQRRPASAFAARPAR